MRKAGILLPISSLPSPHGIGTLGRAAYNFVDFLTSAGQSLWQILPTGPTGFGDSPYQSFSAFAGNPYSIDLDLLCDNGLLAREEIGESWGEDAASVDYGKLYEKRFALLRRATSRFLPGNTQYQTFCRQNAYWLDDYALFMAIKRAQGDAGFSTWPAPLRLRHEDALAEAQEQYRDEIEFWRCAQHFFFTQWTALKRYANARGVGIVGDIPIYVSDDSSDLWANPQLFQLDDAGLPSAVAGVPPDGFSADGQLWGNPLYNWPHHRQTGYSWWLRRLAQAGQLFDITRIDHFRGFAGYFAVPAGQPTARVGRWEKGPGIHFIRALRKELPDMQIIAEDLGFLTKDVHELLRRSGYPGMKILQFAFDSREESDYLPYNYPRHTVVYTGTHDNTTTAAWEAEAPPQDVQFARRYLGVAGGDALCPAMIRAALSSVADTAIIPLQDWLGLGFEARFNTPSTLGGANWRWRLVPGQLTDELAGHIRLCTRTYGRLSISESEKEHYAIALLQNLRMQDEVVPGEVEKAASKQASMRPTQQELAGSGNGGESE